MRQTSRWLRMGALLTAVVALTACGGSSGGGGSGDKSSGGTTVLTFWSRDSQKDFIQPIIDKYNASQKKIQVKVTVIPAAEFVQKLGTAAATGTGPDLTSLDLVYAPYFAQAGALQDITTKAKALPYFDTLSPTHLRLGTYQDKIYALPFTAEASVLYYNKGLFKKAGLEPRQAAHHVGRARVRLPRRSPPSAAASRGSTSPARVEAATSSRFLRSSGAAVATS